MQAQTVIVVEDEEKVSRFIVRGLAAERYAVDAASDGTSGLELATTYDYDVIILDLLLPGISGTEVLRVVAQARERLYTLPYGQINMLSLRQR